MQSTGTFSVALALTTGAALGAPQVQDLGSFQPGQSAYDAVISSDGSAAAGEFQGGTGTHPWFWDEARGIQVLDLSGKMAGGIMGLSADGRFAVGWSQASVVELRQAALWDAATGQRQDLGFLPGGQPMSSVRHISGDGSTVAGIARDASSEPDTFRWTQATGMQSLGSIGGLSMMSPLDMSDDGAVVVGASRQAPFGIRTALLWTSASGMQTIPGLAAIGAASTAQGVSNDGRFVVGRVGPMPSAFELFYRDAMLGTIELASAAGIPLGSNAREISGDGQTVLVHTQTPPPVGGSYPESLLWTPATGAVTTLNPTGNFLAVSISDDGSVVAGHFFDQANPLLRPARWTAGVGVEILDDLGDEGQSWRVSADGSTLLGTCRLLSGEYHPAIWRATGELGAGYCGPAVPNSIGQSGTMAISGSNSIGLGQTVLGASQLPPGATAFFMGSTAPAFVFPVLGSEGALCIGGAIGRFIGPGQVQTVSVSGEISISVDASQFPTPGGPVAAAFGEPWYFQAWHRDTTANGSPMSNFTNGATVRFY